MVKISSKKNIWVFAKLSLFLLVLSACSSSSAAITQFEPAPYSTPEQVVLDNEGSTQGQIIILHNISTSQLMLNRVMLNNSGVSAGWSSQIDANQWSALNLQDSAFILSCKKMDTTAWVDVSCFSVLEFYKPKSTLSLPNAEASGSYWMIENRPKQQLFQSLRLD